MKSWLSRVIVQSGGILGRFHLKSISACCRRGGDSTDEGADLAPMERRIILSVSLRVAGVTSH